ncbi:MAG: hypothetical protein KIS74_02875 [Burkholderiales bacterium]|nr:hypothetical protein [Burkholderiales bacterium]
MGTTEQGEQAAPAAAPAPPAASEGTAVAAVAPVDPIKAERAKQLAEIRERNAHAAAIRGTQWGKELGGMALSAVSHYCTINRLDPARHVEVLGGRIYLTGELYMERGAPLLLKRLVTMDEVDYVHEDAGLNAVVSGADKSATPELEAWARAEKMRRFQQRVKLGIPHDATGAAVVRIRVPGTDSIIVGFNWCGGTSKVKTKKDGTKYRADPVGDAEPVKTAQSRALRRAWRQVMAVLPEYGEDVTRLEVTAIEANATMRVESEKEAELRASMVKNRPLLASGTDADPYSLGQGAAGSPQESPKAGVEGEGSPPAAEGAEKAGEPEPERAVSVCEKHNLERDDDGTCYECERDFDRELAEDEGLGL